ncbi:uncharacterized protein [Parasteatoda tepidariorum]|uniref:uncharacterized protein isoform X1 n=1 Tax=Parasteatoda tepidariorum TaxID=114398 RepID=UPI001C725B16|nr:uncharacterized protein LOC107453697 [Parasteatoda tepidariorum]
MDTTALRMTSFAKAIVICAILHMLLTMRITDSKRTFSSESKLKSQKGESKETLTTNIYYEELQPAAEQKYGTRTLPPSKPYCSTNCDSNKTNKDTENQTSPSRTKYDATNYSKEQRATTTDKLKITNPTKINEKIKFSKQFNPTTGANESGFVPIPSPFKAQSTKATTARRRAKLRSVDELAVKESRQNPNLLGNGHFEILRGGIFSDHETNEIPGGGRRVGNTYDPFALPQFRQVPFDVVQFPSVYQRSQLQLPTHPMFFPRGAFSHKSELKIRQ